MLAPLSPERRAEVEAEAKRMIAEELTLRDLRKALELTQEKLAKRLGVRQESISNLEKRSDLLLSTLQAYVAVLGGNLELVVKFPDRPPLTLEKLADVAGDSKA